MKRLAKPKLVIFLVGESGSGKTTLSNQLRLSGLHVISASATLRKLYRIEHTIEPDRLHLADFGHSLLLRGGLSTFHELLLEELAQYKTSVIDGIRFMETYSALEKFIQKSLIVYLHCDEKIRQARLGSSQVPTSPLKEHFTEKAVRGFRPIADLVLETNQPSPMLLSQIEPFLKLH